MLQCLRGHSLWFLGVQRVVPPCALPQDGALCPCSLTAALGPPVLAGTFRDNCRYHNTLPLIILFSEEKAKGSSPYLTVLSHLMTAEG